MVIGKQFASFSRSLDNFRHLSRDVTGAVGVQLLECVQLFTFNYFV